MGKLENIPVNKCVMSGAIVRDGDIVASRGQGMAFEWRARRRE